MSVTNNQIFYNNKLYAEIPENCGYNQDIIYSDNTYVRFYNYDRNLGCLYNLNNRSTYYLEYDNVDAIFSKYLEYQNNSLKFIYNNESFYLNDITENYNLKMHRNSDYLFTYDSTNYYLRIYNLDTKRIIYEKYVPEFKNCVIENVNIDDYVYFTVNDENNSYIYVWDYLKSNRINKSMIIQNEKEYKFENDKLVSEIKEKYNINVYLYDQAVTYVNNVYVIPSYDEVLIHTRLLSLRDLLEANNYYGEEKNVYFDKEIYLENSKHSLKSYIAINKNQKAYMVSLVNNEFEDEVFNLIIKRDQ